MQYLALASTILSTALFVSAAPTTAATPLERRACSVAYPEVKAFPQDYTISQDSGATNKRDQWLSFYSVPAGAYGCQLEVNFPPGYPITNGGNSRVNVYSVNVKGQREETLVGTVNFNGSPVAPTKYVINSFACADVMTYRLSIASETDAGSVSFADTKEAGISMTYNC